MEGTVTHAARLDAWTERVVKTMESEEERRGQRQTVLSALYGRHLRPAVASVLNVAWNAVKNDGAANIYYDGERHGRAKVGLNTQRE